MLVAVWIELFRTLISKILGWLRRNTLGVPVEISMNFELTTSKGSLSGVEASLKFDCLLNLASFPVIAGKVMAVPNSKSILPFGRGLARV